MRAGDEAAAGGPEDAVSAGHNLLRFWLRPVARQGLDSGGPAAPCCPAARMPCSLCGRPRPLLGRMLDAPSAWCRIGIAGTLS